ncbi:aminomethyl transferase family protein [Streptomyces sp. NBC_00038]|uniref:aminomethyl transferase family protein n=1 Tax=Streptomyces sp. NBC_00038 TaxID=2903615 RepID=UPI00225A9DD1|nr:aminomethyl transferase family protein [Streptomyces sp. NBC_00038]MCX5562905.1 aminomethyl transferase family protein [Streptomyces sp. NBC_00038]
MAEVQRSTYEAVQRSKDAPFIAQRPALFSPAAAAQDESNAMGGFGHFAQTLLPLEYTNWIEECAAHVTSCYLGDWSSLHKVVVRGREALDFLAWLGMRDLSRFEHGQIKHHVQLDENGWVASEGIVCRLDEEEFLYTAGSGDWLMWQLGQGSWDAEVQDVSPDRFIFGIQGPAALDTLEKLTGESLRDIAFSRSRMSRIDGIPVRVLRTGISGELGYELHGPAGHANEIWSATVETGGQFGIRQLGLRSQPVQHIEAGIATNGLDYLPASILTPGAPTQFRRGTPGGSFVPENGITDYFRKPAELGWGFRKGVPDRDFLGRDALASDAAKGEPQRTLTGLRWNAEDIAAILTAPFGPGDVPDPMELPRGRGPVFDQILVGGQRVGVSTGRTVSVNLRSTISLCVLDQAYAAPGTDLVVLWGRPGTAQREIRATVTELPFKPDRRRTDVSTL